MYLPAQYGGTRLDVLRRLIDQHPLGALVIRRADGLDADHLPFEISAPTRQAPFGVLRAHLARASLVWRHDGLDALVLFQRPSAYVSPAC